jgi:hypothetical protein
MTTILRERLQQQHVFRTKQGKRAFGWQDKPAMLKAVI